MLCWSLYPPTIGILWLSLLLLTHLIHFSPLAFFLTLAVILSVYLWFVTFFTLCFQTILFFLSYTLISLTPKQRTNKQKRNNLNDVLPLIAMSIAVTTFCHLYKGNTHMASAIG